MSMLSDFDAKHLQAAGRDLHRFAADLYPICRSITGGGLRQTLAMIHERVPLQLHEVPTGTTVFDWSIPKEWNIRDAYIKVPGGERVVDFQKSNLHVVNYSVPVRATMRLSELRSHLFTLPDHPDWIPYRTSYYQETWGFCLSHRQLLALQDRDYEVCIDSTLAPGHLSYGECYLPGRSTCEVLVSCHACHPSLANDNLSGLAVGTFLAALLAGRNLRYSYRFLFVPGTIGAITWLARNQRAAQNIRYGLVLAGLGDRGAFHYKKSRQGDTLIDRAAAHVLSHSDENAEVLNFSPVGYDERQYCSPGFNLAVGCLTRSLGENFAEYHSSADNLDAITPSHLAGSMRACVAILDVLENDRSYRNLNPFCEPQLGRRNLYSSTRGKVVGAEIHARLWVLNLSDGMHSLLDIAEQSGLPFAEISEAADLLCQAGLLEAASEAADDDSFHARAAAHATKQRR